MTIKEELLQTVEQLDEAAVLQLVQKARELEQSQKERRASVERQLRMLEQFAEPMDDPEAEEALLEAMERRPWFG